MKWARVDCIRYAEPSRWIEDHLGNIRWRPLSVWSCCLLVLLNLPIPFEQVLWMYKFSFSILAEIKNHQSNVMIYFTLIFSKILLTRVVSSTLSPIGGKHDLILLVLAVAVITPDLSRPGANALSGCCPPPMGIIDDRRRPHPLLNVLVCLR